MLGNQEAPVTIVEYTDLQCPYCVAGSKILKTVMAKYGDSVRVVIKNNPLTVHRQAVLAALYFQAVVNQDPKKALLFQDLVFERQDELKERTTFFASHSRDGWRGYS